MPRSLCHALLLLLTCSAFTVSGKLINGIFSRQLRSPGYYRITTVPKGSSSINVTELTESKNYLAVRLSNGKYLFNGDYSITPSGTFPGAGTKFVYIRHNTFSHQTFYTTGTIDESIDVMMIYQHDHPRIFYQYDTEDTELSTNVLGSQTNLMDPERSATTKTLNPVAANFMMGDEIRSTTAKPMRRKRRRMFSWAGAGYSRCSKTCGGGFQSIRYICIRKRKKKANGEDVQVSSNFCKSLPKPTGVSVRCNNSPCPPQWSGGQWSECSVTCGNGTRSRELQCIQEMSESLQVRVDNRHCPKESSVVLEEACFMPDCSAYTSTTSAPVAPSTLTTKQYVAPPHWKVEEWSPCSATCGEGSRTRTVTCVTSGNPCNPKEQPAAEETCYTESCSTKSFAENEIPEALTETSWMYSAWPESCPAECGTGIKTRRLYCDDYVKNKPCDEQNMPAMNKTCTNQTCGQWFVGPWTACSSSCEIGIAIREVVCVSRFLGHLKVVDPKNCFGDKPDTTKGCQGPPCNATWFMSDWSRCSKNCGTGVQKRVVKCIGPDGMPINESVSECDEEKRPPSMRNCNEISCNERRDAKNAFSSVESNNFGTECRDTLSECSKLRIVRAKESKYKCQLEIYKKACCKACRYYSFRSSTG